MSIVDSPITISNLKRASLALVVAAAFALPARADLASDRAAWKAAQAQIAPSEKSYPSEAGLRYRKFLREHTDLAPEVAVDAISSILNVYENRLHDIETTKSIRAWALAKYANAPGIERLKAGYKPKPLPKAKPIDPRIAAESAKIEANLKAIRPTLGGLNQVGAPAPLTPAQAWGVPDGVVGPVQAPVQNWNPSMIDDQLKVAMSGLKGGKFLAERPSTNRMAQAIRDERAQAKADAARQIRITAQLKGLFHNGATSFWSVEPVPSADNEIDKLWPLKAKDAKRTYYKAAATVAERFVVLQMGNGRADKRTPAALYLAAMGETSLGDHDAALRSIDVLLASYPDYRYQRAGQKTDEAVATRTGLTHLRLFHLARMMMPGSGQPATKTNANPLALALVSFSPNVGTKPNPNLTRALQNNSALQMLSEIAGQAAQVMTEEAALAPKPVESVPTDSAASAETDAKSAQATLIASPDQLRAAALPNAKDLAIQLHDGLLTVALNQSGGPAVRNYLRTLLGADKPFAEYATAKLVSIDAQILAQYTGEAERAITEKRWNDARAWLQRIVAEYDGLDAAKNALERIKFVTISQYQEEAVIAMAAHKFKDARGFYKAIVDEFPGTDAAEQAKDDIKKSVPIAVTYYKGEADKLYHPEDQFGIAQSEAAVLYQKMYQEDPEGPLSDGALCFWSLALGTEGRLQEEISNLKILCDKYHNSPYRSKALYNLGFVYGSYPLQQSHEAIDWMSKLIVDYPDSSEASEAQWHISFYFAYEGQFEEAIRSLRLFYDKYPNSVRRKNVDNWLSKFREKLSKGERW